MARNHASTRRRRRALTRVGASSEHPIVLTAALAVLVALGGTSLGAVTTSVAEAQTTSDVVCVDERISFDNDDDAPRIRADVAEFFEQTLELPFAEPPGRYEILVSTFEIFSREGQFREQVNVIVNGQTFGPTPDLGGETDGVLEELNDVSLGFVTVTEPIEAVTIRHAFAGEPGVGPESIRLRDVTLVCTPNDGSDVQLDINNAEANSPDSNRSDSTPVITGTPATDTSTSTPVSNGSDTPATPGPSDTPDGSPDSGGAPDSGVPATPATPIDSGPGTPGTPANDPGQPNQPGEVTDETIPVTITNTDPPPPTTKPAPPVSVTAATNPPTNPVPANAVPTEPGEVARPTQPSRDTQPTTVEGNQSLPRTGSGSGLLAVSSLLMLAFGAVTMLASRRLAPRDSKLSPRYLASLEKVFTTDPDRPE